MSEVFAEEYQITIDGLEAYTVIGLNAWEREVRQKVEMRLVLSVAECCDAIDDGGAPAVDYRGLTKAVLDLVGGAAYRLLEALASAVCDKCLEYEGVKGVELHVAKPRALRYAKSVGVRMSKRKSV